MTTVAVTTTAIAAAAAAADAHLLFGANNKEAETGHAKPETLACMTDSVFHFCAAAIFVTPAWTSA